ncbi:MAG: hypothetical protein QM702_14480 [Rubrivivax sp.]
MRHPPPVAVTCSGGVPWRVVQTLLAALAAAAAAAWASAWLADGRPSALIALVAALAAGLLAWRRAEPRPVDLVWDGAEWRADGTPCAAAVAIDLGRWMLLRLSLAQAPTRWLALDARETGPRLHLLRAALYCAAAPAASSPHAPPSRPAP